MFSFTFHDLLAKNLGERPGHTALACGPTTVSYAELNRQVEATAAWLHARGVGRGDFVGIHLHKSIDEVVATFAASRLGAVFVNVNYQWTLHQLEYVINDCRMRVLFTDLRRVTQMKEAGLLDALEFVIAKRVGDKGGGNVAEWEDFPDGRVPSTARKPLDVDLAALLYTSGSTGEPKGVMLTHLNVLQGARSVATYLHNTAQDRVLSVLPFSFDYGLNQLTTVFLVGGTLVLQPVAMAAEIVKATRDHEITGMAAVPPLWIQITRFLEEQPTAFPTLRYITNSGGKIPGPILDALPRVFPQTDIYLMYGLTEAFRSTYLPPEEYESKKGAIGRAIPNVDVYVVDPNSGLCGPGGKGELIHRGSLISQGYYGRPDETDACIKSCPPLEPLIGKEKVLYSGDVVEIDEDGCLWFVSRIDSLIKCSGFRISPTEVEDVVHQSELVTEVVAFGVEDHDLGQVVHIAVQPRSDGSLDREVLMAYCKKHMPNYMIPRNIYLWTGEMPKTSSGKIDRKQVINRAKPV